MVHSAPKKRPYGCLIITAIVVALFAIGFAVKRSSDDERVYIAPISSHAEIASFAKAKLDSLQAQSFAAGVEYCGMIYENRDGELSSTETFKGDDGTCDFEFEWGGDLNPVASYHTHGAHSFDYDNEAPSLIDLEEDFKNKVDGYIATPGGRLWRIDWKARQAVQVCGLDCVTQDPDFQPCLAYPVERTYTLETLESRIENDPDRC